MVSLGQAFRVWLRVGLLSFGGPAGQIALMHRILVEERRWISNQRFLHALNYCMLLPGPEAQQLATYIGWLLHRTRGGLLAGTLFVLPGFLVILVLSALYAGFHDTGLIQALFYGIKAAVLAVVVEAVLRIGRRALANRAMVAVAVAAFVAIFFFTVPFPLIILGAVAIGLIGGRAAPAWFGLPGAEAFTGGRQPAALVDRLIESGQAGHIRPSRRRALKVLGVCLPLWFGPILVLGAALGWSHVFVEAAVFFSKVAVVTFGGAYAVLAYVAHEAVNVHGWLHPGEMLDGLGMAETTPGPLILVLEFVGYLAAYRDPGSLPPLAAGVLGAGLVVWVTFVPCFLWIFLGAPYVEALRGNRVLAAALSAITAAVVGVVLNLGLWFGLHVVFGRLEELQRYGIRWLIPDWASLDPWALALSLAAMVALLRLRLGMLPVLGLSAALGILILGLRG